MNLDLVIFHDWSIYHTFFEAYPNNWVFPMGIQSAPHERFHLMDWHEGDLDSVWKSVGEQWFASMIQKIYFWMNDWIIWSPYINNGSIRSSLIILTLQLMYIKKSSFVFHSFSGMICRIIRCLHILVWKYSWPTETDLCRKQLPVIHVAAVIQTYELCQRQLQNNIFTHCNIPSFIGSFWIRLSRYEQISKTGGLFPHIDWTAIL